MTTRGELEIARAMMHVLWSCYAHLPVAYARCQQLIDRVGAPSC